MELKVDLRLGPRQINVASISKEPQPMAKRIVICADGTWNRPEKDLKRDFPTNVLRLARAVIPVAKDKVPQQVFYAGASVRITRVSAAA